MDEVIDFDAHVSVVGKTQSGKTVFVAKYFEENDGVNIFFNLNEIYAVEQAADHIVSTVNEVYEIINNLEQNDVRICFNPEEAGEDITIEQVASIINMAFGIGAVAKRQAKGNAPNWCTIIIDEVQTYGEKAGHPAIHRLFKRGWSYGIRGVAISQRPADVSHTILTQSMYHVIFFVGDYDHPYFRKYGIPIEEHMEHIEFRSYRFVIWDGDTITRYDKVQYQE